MSFIKGLYSGDFFSTKSAILSFTALTFASKKSLKYSDMLSMTAFSISSMQISSKSIELLDKANNEIKKYDEYTCNTGNCEYEYKGDI